MKIIISNKFKILRIIKCKSRKDLNKKINFFINKNNKNIIWQSLSKDCPYKVGDLTPFSNDENLFLVKRFGKIKKNKRIKNSSMFLDKTELNLKLIKKYITSLNKKKIEDVSKLVSNLEKDEEVFYRVFYNSFKMYRLRSYCFILAQALKHLLEDDYLEFDEKKYLNTLNLNNFDKTLSKSLDKVFETQFTMSCNHLDVWAEDARNLTGTYLMFLKAVKNVLSFSNDIINKKGLLYNKKSNILNWHEAASMEIYLPLRELRYHSDDFMKDLSSVL